MLFVVWGQPVGGACLPWVPGEYALDEAYDRVLTGDDKKMKKIAMENLRTKGELLYRIENQHHQRDNRSYGQKLRHAIKNNQSK